MAYPLALVGCQHYQNAINELADGDAVQILIEHGNPYDASALVAVDADAQTIGYVQKDSWLRRAVAKERKAFRARVKAVEQQDRGHLAVVIDVEPCGGPMGARAYRAS